MTSVSIIIPVYNNWFYTQQCLQSLAEHTPNYDVEVIVVDNASSDNTKTDCPNFGRSLFGNRFRSFHLENNINFGPACNFGASKSNSSLLFFLNNDTIVTSNWITPLMQAIKQRQIGAVGPLLLYPQNNRVQHLGVCFWIVLAVSHLFEHHSKESKVVRKQRYFQAITGAAFMISRNLFNSCGGFFSEFKNGFEDADLCSRIKEKGLRMTCIPESEIFHYASKSTGRFSQEHQNFLLMKERCSRSFHLDFHKWCSEEGYEIRISNIGNVYMATPEEVSIEYMNHHKNKKNICALWDFLYEEPLWEEGYELMSTWLEGIEAYSEAIKMRTLQNTIFPKLHTMKRILELGIKSENHSVISNTKQEIQDYIKRMPNTEDIYFNLALYANFFKHKGDIKTSERLRRQLINMQNLQKFHYNI